VSALRNLITPSIPQWSSGTPDVAPPLEDETPEERRYNERLASALLDGRIGLASADGLRSGFGEVLASAFSCHAFGFSVLVPYWEGRSLGDEGAGLESGQRLIVEPLAQSSVARWIPDPETQDYREIAYYTTNGFARATNKITRDQLVHFTHRGLPGQYYGDGELRALVLLYELLSTIRRQQYQINQRSTGVVVVREGPGAGNANRGGLESQLERFGDGQPWVVVPQGADFSVQFPSGSPPNLIEQIRHIDAEALNMWASMMDVLGVSQHGSRAVAGEMEAKAARVNANGGEGRTGQRQPDRPLRLPRLPQDRRVDRTGRGLPGPHPRRGARGAGGGGPGRPRGAVGKGRDGRAGQLDHRGRGPTARGTGSATERGRARRGRAVRARTQAGTAQRSPDPSQAKRAPRGQHP
jgi:hypothetical protein